MKDWPGFNYDARRKTLVLDGYVRGSRTTRRRRTVRNVTRDQALEAWKEFRDELASGRAILGPVTLRAFVHGYYNLIAASHAAGTRKTQGRYDAHSRAFQRAHALHVHLHQPTAGAALAPVGSFDPDEPSERGTAILRAPLYLIALLLEELMVWLTLGAFVIHRTGALLPAPGFLP